MTRGFLLLTAGGGGGMIRMAQRPEGGSPVWVHNHLSYTPRWLETPTRRSIICDAASLTNGNTRVIHTFCIYECSWYQIRKASTGAPGTRDDAQALSPRFACCCSGVVIVVAAAAGTTAAAVQRTNNVSTIWQPRTVRETRTLAALTQLLDHRFTRQHMHKQHIWYQILHLSGTKYQRV